MAPTFCNAAPTDGRLRQNFYRLLYLQVTNMQQAFPLVKTLQPLELLATMGMAFLYSRNVNNNWILLTNITASDVEAGDRFGASVSLDSGRLLAGSSNEDASGQDAGAADVFYKDQGGANAWGQVARMCSQQSKENDNFGGSVDLSGGWAFVGASNNDLQGDNAGAAFLFQKNLKGINDG